MTHSSKMEALLEEYNRLSSLQAIEEFNLSRIKLYEKHVIRRDGGKTRVIKLCYGRFNFPMLKVGIKERYKKGGYIFFYFNKPIKEVRELVRKNDSVLLKGVMDKLNSHSERYFKESKNKTI